MPSPLDEDDIKEILRVYDETESKKATAEKLNHSRSTVRKYVDEYYEDWAAATEEVTVEEVDEAGGGQTDDVSDQGDEPLAADEAADLSPSPGPAPGHESREPETREAEWTATPPGETPIGRPEEESGVDDGDVDFATMGYGEFIEWFFSQHGHGVRQNFADLMAQKAKMKKQLPNEKTMKYSIKEASSGVNNEFNCEMIAETYWDVAEQYLKAQPQQGSAHQGGWVDRDQNQQGQQSQGTGRESEWVGREQQGNQRHQSGRPSWQETRQRSPPSGASQVADQNSWVGGNQQAQQQGGGNQQMQQLAGALKGVQETQQAILKELNGNGSNDNQTLKQQMREFRQAKEELEAIADDGDDDVNQYIQAIQKQMQHLQQQVETQAATSGDGGGNEFQAMVQLAQQDDVDPDTLTTFAEAMGTTDPEVKKAEYELKAQEKKAQNRKEMIDAVFDNLGGVAEQMSGGLVASMLSDDSDDQQQQQQAQQAQQPPQTQPAQQPAQQQGRAPPAGQNGQQQGQQMSGPARRFEELQQEIDSADSIEDMPDPEEAVPAVEEVGMDDLADSAEAAGGDGE